MARLVLLLFIVLGCSPVLVGSPASPPPLISAKAAVLLDRQTGLVLWSHNADAPLPMASTTKVITAMVVLDHGGEKLDQQVTVSKQAAETGGSSLLAAGDMLTLRDLLKSLLIRSSNEATVAAAEYLAGDVETFVQWMNAKAEQILGPDNRTHFVNPHGLYDKERGAEHHSSARDLALLTRYALTHYPLISEIVAQGRPPSKVAVRSYPRGMLVLENHNRILGRPVPGIPGAVVDGVKTGYVNQSGKCLISSATVNGWQLIAVVLGGDQRYFDESMALLRYGFTRYRWTSYADAERAGVTALVARGKYNSVPIGAKGVFGAPVPRQEYLPAVDDRVEFRGARLRAPLQQGQRIGELVLVRDGQDLVSAPAIALQSVPTAWWSRGLNILIYLLLAVLALSVIGKIYGTVAKNRRRRRRLLATASRRIDPGGTHYR